MTVCGMLGNPQLPITLLTHAGSELSKFTPQVEWLQTIDGSNIRIEMYHQRWLDAIDSQLRTWWVSADVTSRVVLCMLWAAIGCARLACCCGSVPGRQAVLAQAQPNRP